MNKFLSIPILALALAAANVSASAQSSNSKPQTEKGQRMSREQMIEQQAKRLASDLSLDSDKTAKLVDAYTKCQKELDALDPRAGQAPEDMPKPDENSKKDKSAKKEKPAEMTDAQAEQEIKKRFDNDAKKLAIRQKYYKVYSAFLSQSQILKIYDHEEHMAQPFPGGGPGGDMNRKGGRN